MALHDGLFRQDLRLVSNTVEPSLCLPLLLSLLQGRARIVVSKRLEFVELERLKVHPRLPFA